MDLSSESYAWIIFWRYPNNTLTLHASLAYFILQVSRVKRHAGNIQKFDQLSVFFFYCLFLAFFSFSFSFIAFFFPALVDYLWNSNCRAFFYLPDTQWCGNCGDVCVCWRGEVCLCVGGKEVESETEREVITVSRWLTLMQCCSGCMLLVVSHRVTSNVS